MFHFFENYPKKAQGSQRPPPLKSWTHARQADAALYRFSDAALEKDPEFSVSANTIRFLSFVGKKLFSYPAPDTEFRYLRRPPPPPPPLRLGADRCCDCLGADCCLVCLGAVFCL